MSEGTETALVIGVTSDIGRAIAHKPADGGCVLQLAGRDPVLPMGALAERRDSGVLAGVSSVASEPGDARGSGRKRNGSSELSSDNKRGRIWSRAFFQSDEASVSERPRDRPLRVFRAIVGTGASQ